MPTFNRESTAKWGRLKWMLLPHSHQRMSGAKPETSIHKKKSTQENSAYATKRAPNYLTFFLTRFDGKRGSCPREAQHIGACHSPFPTPGFLLRARHVFWHARAFC